MKFRFEKGKMFLIVTSLQCHCPIWLMMDRGNLRKSKPTKSPNQMKKETTIQWRNPCDSEIPEWLQEFKEKFGGWWNSITGRLSRQFYSWSFFRGDYKEDVRIWLNRMFILISLKTEFSRSVNGPTKLQGPRAEDAMAKPYLELSILVTW